MRNPKSNGDARFDLAVSHANIFLEDVKDFTEWADKEIALHKFVDKVKQELGNKGLSTIKEIIDEKLLENESD